MTSNLTTRLRFALLVVICVSIAAAVRGYSAGSSIEPRMHVAQDVLSLDRRISSLEQRLYTIESSIRGLEQRVSLSNRPAPAQSARDPELDRLRSEVELLRGRVRELECGLVHVDERTLSASAKEARRRGGGQPRDSCRLNPEAPVQLSARH